MANFLGSSEDYLDATHLAHLRGYKYSAVDLSIVGHYILQPWWRFAAGFLPRWMAPNLVTLIGFMMIMFNVLCLAVFLPDLIGPASSWLYVSFALGLFIYQTMDNLDGKQARATNTSSPLGELFDHVIDSLNCPLGGLVQAASTGVGQSPTAVFFIIVSCWPMYLSSWEQFHTGTLYLGHINGPDDGLLIAMAVIMTSAVQGPGWWQELAGDKLPSLLSSIMPHSMRMQDALTALVTIALFAAHAPFCLLHVAHIVGTRRLPGTLTQLVPLVAYSSAAYIWLLSPYSIVLSDGHLVEFTIALCFLFGRLSTRIILAHLTHGSFPLNVANLVPLALGAALVTVPTFGGRVPRLPHDPAVQRLRRPVLLTPDLERLYLHILVAYTCARFAFSSKRIIDAFCATLGIDCLRIPTRP